MPGTRTSCQAAERSRISIRSASAFQAATWSNASKPKSALSRNEFSRQTGSGGSGGGGVPVVRL